MTCTEAIKNTAEERYLLANSNVQSIFLSGEKKKIGYNCYLQYSFFFKTRAAVIERSIWGSKVC